MLFRISYINHDANQRKVREVYNKSMKSWLEDDSIETHSTNNGGKSIVTERSIKTLNSKIYKHMT